MIVGTAAAGAPYRLDRALLAGVVALAVQIGANYANDYSDGIRGTDANRTGPPRLVASGAASPVAVLRAALIAFAIAAVAGIALSLLTNPWLIAGGLAAILAAWYYTGGSKPYGYAGFGEVSVFVFFGLFGTLGSTYVQHGELTPIAVWAAIAVGSLTSALLVANNLRDIPGDAAKRGSETLAVDDGDRATRQLLYIALLGAAVAIAHARRSRPRLRPWALARVRRDPGREPARTNGVRRRDRPRARPRAHRHRSPRAHVCGPLRDKPDRQPFVSPARPPRKSAPPHVLQQERRTEGGAFATKKLAERAIPRTSVKLRPYACTEHGWHLGHG